MVQQKKVYEDCEFESWQWRSMLYTLGGKDGVKSLSLFLFFLSLSCQSQSIVNMHMEESE